MPKRSERKALIGEINRVLEVAMLEADANEDEDQEHTEMNGEWTEWDSDIGELHELLCLIEASRYLSVRQVAPRSVEFARAYFYSLPEMEFRQLTRTTRESFEFIVNEIIAHPIFHSNSNNHQAPVWLQLAVALDRLGNYGNGASLGRTHKLWGIGKGTCCEYTRRVVLALTSLTSKYVRWPSPRERRAMSDRMAQRGFRGCVGFIDGTTIPISQRPRDNGWCFFDRKQRYSLNAQVVCDDQQHITQFYSGWTGSRADSSVYKEMQLAKNDLKRQYFDAGQYLLADSAYPADHDMATLVPAYKSNTHGTDIEDFNTCVAHVRVVNEHTIGVFKNRWGSLKELRVQLNEPSDMERALAWMAACVVLHNMLVHLNDDWDDSERNGDEDEAIGNDNAADDDAAADDDDRYEFRRAVKRRAIAKAREPGGILWYREQIAQ